MVREKNSIEVIQDIRLTDNCDESNLKKIIKSLIDTILHKDKVLMENNHLLYKGSLLLFSITSTYKISITNESLTKEEHTEILNSMIYITKQIQQKLIELDYLKRIETTILINGNRYLVMGYNHSFFINEIK